MADHLFARGTETKELRSDAPADLVRALDALALSCDMARNHYVNQVLEKHVLAELERMGREVHRTTLLAQMLHGNPLLSVLERHQTGATQ